MSGMVEGKSQSSSEIFLQVDLNLYMSIIYVIFIVFENPRGPAFRHSRGIGTAEGTCL